VFHVKLSTYNPVAHEHTHDFLLIRVKVSRRLDVSVCICYRPVRTACLLDAKRVFFVLSSEKELKNLFGGESMGNEDVEDV
jgi:hypothetical protein